MSDSYRTAKPAKLANDRLEKTAGGDFVGLRIIERKPYPGDIHPVPRKELSTMLHLVPAEYLYKLKEIELKPRNGDVGRPYAVYLPGERRIKLYSLPLIWRFKSITQSSMRQMMSYRAEFSFENDWIIIDWQKKDNLAFWFFCEVIFHELGHHRRFKFAHRDGLGGHDEEEKMADVHKKRLKDRLSRMVLKINNKGRE